MNLARVLQKKLQRLNFFIQKYKEGLKTFSRYRVLIFLIFICSSIFSYLYREYLFLIVIPFLFLFLFVYLVYVYERISNYVSRLQIFKHFLEREYLRAQRKISELERQKIENEQNHFYKDLDVLGKNSLYNFLDTTVTKSGNNLFLKSILQTNPLDLEEILERQSCIQELCESKHFSKKVLRLLNEVSPSNGYTKITLGKYLFSLQEYFKKHFLQERFEFVLILNYILILFSFLFDKLEIVYSLFLIQLVFAYWNFREKSKLKKNIQAFIDKTEDKERLLIFIAKKNFKTELLKNSFMLNEKDIRELFSSLKKVANKASIWNSPLLNFILNVFFLWDFLIFKDLLYFESQFKNRFIKVLEGLELLDSLLPFFVFYYHNQESEFPSISHNVQHLRADWIAHPFLNTETRVGNPLEAIPKGKGILITGSNMSGKTTYLRTIGINVLLALCGAPTLSKGLSLPPLKILSSIRNEDSLQDGISFFYAEVKKIRYILEETENSKLPCLILIDEILKGTNTRERVIATKKILERLQEYPTFILVTTHDLDLAKDMQKTNFFLKHFEEQIQNGKMSFDYKIRDGLVTSSNALKLLALEYPRIQFLDS